MLAIMCMNCFFHSCCIQLRRQNCYSATLKKSYVHIECMLLICIRISSDFNLKIITTCVDICELQILMNVLSRLSPAPCTVVLVGKHATVRFFTLMFCTVRDMVCQTILTVWLYWAFAVWWSYHLWPHTVVIFQITPTLVDLLICQNYFSMLFKD